MLVVAEHDLGPAIVIVVIGVAVGSIAGTPSMPLTVAVMGLAAAAVAMMGGGLPPRRLDGLYGLAADKNDIGFQVWQSVIGIASGGLTDLGSGAARAK